MPTKDTKRSTGKSKTPVETQPAPRRASTKNRHGEFDFMDTADVARALKMTVGGLRVNLNRARDRRETNSSLVTDAPLPDGYLGRSPIWKPETIQTWIARREEYGLKPRRGGRPQRFVKRPPKVSSGTAGRKRKTAA